MQNTKSDLIFGNTILLYSQIWLIAKSIWQTFLCD